MSMIFRKRDDHYLWMTYLSRQYIIYHFGSFTLWCFLRESLIQITTWNFKKIYYNFSNLINHYIAQLWLLGRLNLLFSSCCLTVTTVNPDTSLIAMMMMIMNSLFSDRQYLSYDVCLEVRGEIIRTVLCCIVYWSCAQS